VSQVIHPGRRAIRMLATRSPSDASPHVVMPTLVLKGGTRVRTRSSAGSRCSSKPRASAGGELASVPFNSSLQHDAAGATRRVNPARNPCGVATLTRTRFADN
jgi:hypothetical protein